MRSNTFFSGTRVCMVDGTQKNVEDLQVGDRIRTENGPAMIRDTYTGVERVYEFDFEGDSREIVDTECACAAYKKKEY